MARWKALAEFLISVIELLFLSLTVEALQGKTCQNSQPSGVGRSLGARISGGRGRPWGILFTARRNARIASAVLAIAIPSVRPSVRPSFCPSHAGIVSKRRHVARCSLHCWIAKCV